LSSWYIFFLFLHLFFLAVLEFELSASCLLGRHSTTWATLPENTIFCVGYFQDRVLWTLCPGWPQTMILLISASWVTRIISMSYWHPAGMSFFQFIGMLLWKWNFRWCNKIHVCLGLNFNWSIFQTNTIVRWHSVNVFFGCLSHICFCGFLIGGFKPASQYSS
jgi:hypothetical protein